MLDQSNEQEEKEDITLTMGALEKRKEEEIVSGGTIQSKIVLSSESKLINMFTLLIIVFAVMSIIMSAYYTCFGYRHGRHLRNLDIVMEVSFGLDILRNFFTEFVVDKSYLFSGICPCFIPVDFCCAEHPARKRRGNKKITFRFRFCLCNKFLFN